MKAMSATETGRVLRKKKTRASTNLLVVLCRAIESTPHVSPVNQDAMTDHAAWRPLCNQPLQRF